MSQKIKELNFKLRLLQDHFRYYQVKQINDRKTIHNLINYDNIENINVKNRMILLSFYQEYFYSTEICNNKNILRNLENEIKKLRKLIKAIQRQESKSNYHGLQ